MSRGWAEELNRKTNCNIYGVMCCGVCNFEYVDRGSITEETKIKEVMELAM